MLGVLRAGLRVGCFVVKKAGRKGYCSGLCIDYNQVNYPLNYGYWTIWSEKVDTLTLQRSELSPSSAKLPSNSSSRSSTSNAHQQHSTMIRTASSLITRRLPSTASSVVAITSGGSRSALPSVSVGVSRGMTILSKESKEEFKKEVSSFYLPLMLTIVVCWLALCRIIKSHRLSRSSTQNYSARMAKTRRPVSPHVTIYSFPVCALSSIATRVTGCILSFGAAGLGIVEIFGGSGAALSTMQCIGSGEMVGGALFVAGAKFSVAFPFAYHYLGGLRHLVWDNSPEMLTNVDVEKASYGLLGASVLLSSVAAVV